MRALEAGNLAAQAHEAERVLHRPLQRESELGDRVFHEIGRALRRLLAIGHRRRFASFSGSAHAC
jgi:hypothetical protein